MGKFAAVASIIAMAGLMTGCAGHMGTWPEQVSSARSILEQPVDDQKVVLRGRITERVKDEKYWFSDDTGQILVEIDDDEWPQGRPVLPDQVVEIYGEVDRDHGKAPEIEVKRVTLVPPSPSPASEGPSSGY